VRSDEYDIRSLLEDLGPRDRYAVSAWGSKGTLPFYAERKASRETSVKLFDLPLGEKR
jgi:hypothetical protein